jgi:ABC-type hemin transport system ATPase subunit
VLRGGSIEGDGDAAAIITHEMLGRVFEVDVVPGQVPRGGAPFILPQVMTAATGVTIKAS